MNSTIYVHTDDLRIEDNKSLREIAQKSAITPIYVYDEDLLRIHGERYQEQLEEALTYLKNQYEDQGATLHILKGTFTKIIPRLAKTSKIHISYPTRNILLQQHIGTLQEKNVEITCNLPLDVETAETGIQKARNHLKKPALPKANITYVEKTFQTETDITNNQKRQQYYKQRMQILKQTIKDYPKIVGNPYLAEQQTSRISHILATGTKSIRQAYQDTKHLSTQTRLLNRYVWSIRFKQKAYKNKLLYKKPLNTHFTDNNIYNENKTRHEQWVNAETGYPLVDASMNALNKTGYTNFRMRALLATFYTHILKQPWWKGATYMHKQLIDADPTINYYQWQMQSNTLGVHPLRIYNPKKQHEEKDPRSKYIKKYVPTLKNVSSEDIKKEKLPESYPQKTVQYKKEARKTRQWFKKHQPNIIRQAKKQNLSKQALLSKKSTERLNKAYNKISNTLHNYI